MKRCFEFDEIKVIPPFLYVQCFLCLFLKEIFDSPKVVKLFSC